MKFRSLLSPVSVLALVVGLSGCSAAPGASGDDGGDGADGGGNGDGGNGSGTGSNTGGTSGQFMGTSGTGSTSCVSGPDEDQDQDGFTVTELDCNDCDPNVNPGAIEVISNDPMMAPADEDCDGQTDNVAVACDSGLALNSSDPLDGARAIELCKQATGPEDWGVVSANWVRADGAPAGATQPSEQHGILAGFGTNVSVRGGENMLALSSGRARTPGQTGACTSQTCTSAAGTAPSGFPQDVPDCAGSTTINDDIGLEVTLRAPTNATGYRFDFKFYSFEFAEWVCTSYNDQFIALVNPPPMGSVNGNVSFDSMNNPVSVNIAFFDFCDTCSDWASFCSTGTCPPQPTNCCPGGNTEILGTGFDVDAGGTSWLQTSAPVTGGETISIRFAIWDTGDHALDSTSLVDNFQWVANGGTVTVGTTPAPPM